MFAPDSLLFFKATVPTVYVLGCGSHIAFLLTYVYFGTDALAKVVIRIVLISRLVTK